MRTSVRATGKFVSSTNCASGDLLYGDGDINRVLGHESADDVEMPCNDPTCKLHAAIISACRASCRQQAWQGLMIKARDVSGSRKGIIVSKKRHILMHHARDTTLSFFSEAWLAGICRPQKTEANVCADVSHTITSAWLVASIRDYGDEARKA